MTRDRFGENSPALHLPASYAAAVTPSDTVNLTNLSRGLYVGSAGNVSCLTAGGDTVTLANVPAGSLLPVRLKRVNSTGTTASNMVVLW